MPEERPPAVACAVDGRLVAGVEEQDAGGDQLPLGQRVAVVHDGRQAADQVVARVGAPVREEGPQVVPELDARLDRLARRGLGWVELVHEADVGRPRPQLVAIRLRDPEQLGDDRHRQRLDIVCDEVDLARAADRVEQAVDDRLDAPAHGFDGSRRERLEDQPPEPRVIGWFEVEHARVVEVVERRVPGGWLRAGPSRHGSTGGGRSARDRGRAGGGSRRRGAR